MKRIRFSIRTLIIIVTLVLSLLIIGCPVEDQQQTSDSGVKKTSVDPNDIQKDEQGRTVEQLNYLERLKRDNELGSIKHLYVVSSYSGDVLEYSTVKGKVTSGGKRITPTTVVGDNPLASTKYNKVLINGETFVTHEMMDDNGTYGSSTNYIYWFDAQGNYHQYFPSGGTYIHISDRPLKTKKAVVTFEMQE